MAYPQSLRNKNWKTNKLLEAKKPYKLHAWMLKREFECVYKIDSLVFICKTNIVKWIVKQKDRISWRIPDVLG